MASEEQPKFAGFKPETARQMLDAFRLLQASGILAPGALSRIMQRTPPQDHLPIYFTNVSGEEIPPYACMQVTGTSEIGPQNYLQVSKPVDSDGNAGIFIFNGHWAVANGDQGVAQPGRVVRGFKASGTVTAGDKWQPTAGAWTVEQDDGGQFVACGEDDIAANVLKLGVASGAGGGAGIEYTIDSIATAGTSSPYNGLVVATVTVKVAPCDRTNLIGETVEVVDHAGCIFDLAEVDLQGVWGWAHEGIAESLAVGAAQGTLTPCHWSATNRCCTAEGY